MRGRVEVSHDRNVPFHVSVFNVAYDLINSAGFRTLTQSQQSVHGLSQQAQESPGKPPQAAAISDYVNLFVA